MENNIKVSEKLIAWSFSAGFNLFNGMVDFKLKQVDKNCSIIFRYKCWSLAAKNQRSSKSPVEKHPPINWDSCPGKRLLCELHPSVVAFAWLLADSLVVGPKISGNTRVGLLISTLTWPTRSISPRDRLWMW